MAGEDYDFVLFDLGGVLVRFAGTDAMQRLAGIQTVEEVWRRWLTCRWVRSFESGRCSAEDFATGVVKDWELSVEPEAFLAQFRTWPEALFDGATELVAEVRKRVPVACLSNTNALHWSDQAASFGFGEMFDAQFLSHELGMLKPDREVFEHVLRCLGVPGQRVVFLDDNDANVEEARAVGLTSARVAGTGEAADALVDLGVLPRAAGPPR